MSSFKGATMDFTLRFSTYIAAVLVLVGDLASFGYGIPVALTNAQAASELQPRQVEPPSYWIGSHTLDFTPNPFLIGGESRQNAQSLESSIVTNILSSPSSSTTEIPRRRGRKLKRRRRLGNQNSKPGNPNRRGLKQPNEKAIKESKAGGNVGIQRSRRLGGRRQNGLNQPEVELKEFKPFPLKIAKITTPHPVIADLDPRSSEISRSFANIHPENLSPAYFRSIILKAMMDRLVGAKAVTRTISEKPVIN